MQNNLANLKNRQFSYTEVRDMLAATLVKSGVLTGSGGNWTLEFDQAVPGITTDKTYSSIPEAIDAVLPIFFSEHGSILKAVA